MEINGEEINVFKYEEIDIDEKVFWINQTSIFNKTHKSCSVCKKIKEFCEFNNDKNYFLKKKSECKECQKEYNRNNKDKIKEYKKEYYEENKDKIKEQHKEYNKKNKEKIKEQMKEYRKEYNKKNKEKIKEQMKEYNNSPPFYNTYSHKLSIDEKCKRDGEFLSVKCTYCGKYFYPTNSSVRARISSINSLNLGECRLYCSDGCKQECPTYGSQRGNPNSSKLARESNPVLRQAVLKRDSYECQRCGNVNNLHCHHIIPVKTDPGMAEDTDNCLTFCRTCHYWVHGMIDGCGLGDLRKQKDKCYE